MKTLGTIFFIIHLLAVAGLVILLLMQAGKATKKLPKGLTHAGLTALVAGIAMVIVRAVQHHDNAAQYPNYSAGIIGAKFVVLIIFLVVAFKNATTETISRATWASLLGLIVINIGLAGSLK